MRKYLDIERLKDKYANAFTEGENIVVQTKIDGANASFTYNPETNTVDAFSRKNKLNEINNLRGFYEFTQKFDIELIKKITQNGRFIIFGEWLVPHTIKYEQDMYNKFYMFDVWDCEIEQYIRYEDASAMYAELMLAASIGGFADKMNFVPVVYIGKFTTWEEVMKLLIVRTTSAETCEEGIVIKSQDRLDNKSSSTPAYVKIVNEKFSEVHQSKPHVIDQEKLAAKEKAMNLAKTIVTARRVTKCIEKMIDTNIIPESWDEHDMKTIAKTLPKMIYEDCKKEEPEVVDQIENFGKVAAGISMSIARAMIK